MKRPVKGAGQKERVTNAVGQGTAFCFSCEIFPLTEEELMR